ncbi:zinc metallochaperone AztD [Streptomyces sp. TRM 70351]|uniref:zinc metallochaperone AztD n=1 Tax=Streptomyces sp. TRM 70351 TaxID=3116552 RepID=UPI002E7B9191|nr:zinc metallochaperone AztD [Streptomyces sp. TRM 70351]MEE1927160.1 zinc metallochaperone AztD [Streptomyces sp. TRM 70351]
MTSTARPAKATGIALLLASSLALTACGAQDTKETPAAETSGSDAASPAGAVADPVVTTYDGGLYVLDGETLEVAEDISLPGFNRVNPAGDDRHVMVSTSTGFRVLDAAGGRLTDIEFAGDKPGHVVHHAGRTVLFTDGTGEVTSFDPGDLAGGKPESTTYASPSAHHGVAIELANGHLVTTLGTEEERVGITVLDEEREEITRSEECPGIHGEATARDEAVVVGCEDGVLIYKDGAITKVDSPTAYGRIGNQAGSEESPIVLGDYKKDADAELERPEQVSLIDTRTGTLRLVDLGTSYTFRSLARGPHGEALVLGTDGKIHVIDPEEGEVTRTIPVIDQWREPLEWQQPRPALFVRDHTVYVSDPATRQMHAVDVESGERLASVTLPQAPNEVSGVTR